MNQPFISFIIPVYNGEQHLSKCIDSILMQTIEKTIEIILINDGSTDSSGRICSEYVHRYPNIISVHNRENRGQGNARNYGIDMSKGKWITFLDNDDWLDKNWFEECADYIEEFDDIVIWGKRDILQQSCKEYFANSSNPVDRIEHKELILSVLDTCHSDKLEYRGLSLSTPWGKLFKSSLIRDHQCRFVESYGEDRLFLLKAYEAAQDITIVKKAFYNYRIHESAMRKYLPDAARKYLFSVNEMNSYVQKHYHNDSEIIGALYKHNVAFFSYSVRQDFCNAHNQENYFVRKKRFIISLENRVYNEAFHNADLSKLPFRRKILAVLIRKRAFFLINLLSYTNNFYDRYFVWG